MPLAGHADLTTLAVDFFVHPLRGLLQVGDDEARVVFRRDQQKYIDRNAVVLGVSVDSVDSHQKFCTKEGLNFELLSDADHTVTEEYGSLTNLGLVKFASRHTFIINPEGKIAKVYTDVNPNKHSDEVLAALAELQK